MQVKLMQNVWMRLIFLSSLFFFFYINLGEKHNLTEWKGRKSQMFWGEMYLE